ncbi:hypothetical protein [Georgenia faecalis]|uniref:hypothetical protein n=1 Tax=Georgenia faecalis TaxID=2483799 RepID=UPI000FDBF6AE|nr:hypothetical protein [Georgenia faecalis]
MSSTGAAAARAAILLLLGVPVAGCSAPDVPTDDAITLWMDGHLAEEAPAGSLGAATGRFEAGDAVSRTEGGVVLLLDAAPWVETIQLSCFGEGTADFTVDVAATSGGGGTEATSIAYADVPCGLGVQEEPIAVAGVTSVGVTGSGAGGAGAWHAVVIGGKPG